MYMLFYILGILVGWLVRDIYVFYRVKAFLNEIESSEKNYEDDEKPELIHINIEKHEGILFVYNSEDDSFMAQGNSRDELESKLRERYPNVIFGATNDNLEKVGFK